MGVKQLRLDKGWSQEELSQLSGLSVRTIQRIEQGNKAGLESLKALASVFELQVSDLNCADSHSRANSPSQQQGMTQMNEDIKDAGTGALDERAAVIAQVKRIKAFNKSLVSYLGVILLLLVINLLTSPGYFWVVWPALGWGIALLIQGLSAHEVINLFGSDWEKKQIAKRLNKHQD